eukprot:437708_1
MIFEIDEAFRAKAICCDVSWISKFGITECEILIARSIDAVLNSFECKIIDAQNGTQIVSLRSFGDTQQRKNINKILPAQQNEEPSIDNATPTDYLDMYMTSQKQNMVMTESQKDIVRIFIRSSATKKNIRIPSDVFDLIYRFYDDNNGFIVTEGMQLSNKHDRKTLLNTASSSTAYYDIPLFGYVASKLVWIFYIDIGKLLGNIVIGVQNTNSTHHFREGFYGFDNSGNVYENVSSSRNGPTFKQKDCIWIEYDGRLGILRFKHVGTYKYSYEINTINSYGNYSLAISVQGENNKIDLMETAVFSKTDMLMQKRKEIETEERILILQFGIECNLCYEMFLPENVFICTHIDCNKHIHLYCWDCIRFFHRNKTHGFKSPWKKCMKDICQPSLKEFSNGKEKAKMLMNLSTTDKFLWFLNEKITKKVSNSR